MSLLAPVVPFSASGGARVGCCCHRYVSGLFLQAQLEMKGVLTTLSMSWSRSCRRGGESGAGVATRRPIKGVLLSTTCQQGGTETSSSRIMMMCSP